MPAAPAERLDSRYQWIKRFLANARVVSDAVMAPYGREVLARLSAQGQTVVLLIDQTKVPALGGGGSEGGEMVVADLSTGAIAAVMASPGVIDRDPGYARQTGPQYVSGLGPERILALIQEAQDLTLRDLDANRPQLRDQTGNRDLPLMELDKHEAAQLWSEMTRHVRRHGRHYGLPLRADLQRSRRMRTACGRSMRS